MHTELAGQLRQRLVFPQRRPNHTSLELRRKPPSLPCHRIVSFRGLEATSYPETIPPYTSAQFSGTCSAFRKKIYNTLDELQADLDKWVAEYNEQRPHSGKYCFGKTPMQTFLDSLTLAKEKMLNQTIQTVGKVA